MRLGWEISHGFASGALDLSARLRAPSAGWESLPESLFARELRARGDSDAFVRMAITFLAAMDRARDADELWRRGVKLRTEARWAYEAAEIVARPLSELADVLLASGVSQRHLGDSAAWRRIAEAIVASGPERPVRGVIEKGTGDAGELVDDLRSHTPGGSPNFPYLGGPKVGPMWIRMMVLPGKASMAGLDAVPVAVDVQVRRISQCLGVADTTGMQLEQARSLIQQAWRKRSREDGVDAPGSLANTSAGLDPALWFYAKWGCSHCEPLGYRVPIHAACAACRLPTAPSQVRVIRAPLEPATVNDPANVSGRPLIGLVGCVKTKLGHPAPAQDLYVSELFRGRRAAVEARTARWFILSAEHGLVDPEQVIEPYERTLASLPVPARREWANSVLAALRARLGELGEYDFEIHASADYFAFGLADQLRTARAAVVIPTKGLARGRQLQYYAGLAAGAARNDAVAGIRSRPDGLHVRIAALLEQRGSDEVRLPFEELERLTGLPLPASARQYHAWWHQSQPSGRAWKHHGWRAIPRFAEAAVVFRRDGAMAGERQC